MQSINKHFSREAKIMLWLFVAPIIIGVVLSYVIPILKHHSKVDRCLDSGGKYIYEKHQCNRELFK